MTLKKWNTIFPFVMIASGKKGLPFPMFPEIFRWDNPKRSCSIYFPTVFPGNFLSMVNNHRFFSWRRILIIRIFDPISAFCKETHPLYVEVDNRQLKNHDDDDWKWVTVYCASKTSKFRRRGVVDDAKQSRITSSCNPQASAGINPLF